MLIGVYKVCFRLTLNAAGPLCSYSSVYTVCKFKQLGTHMHNRVRHRLHLNYLVYTFTTGVDHSFDKQDHSVGSLLDRVYTVFYILTTRHMLVQLLLIRVYTVCLRLTLHAARPLGWYSSESTLIAVMILVNNVRRRVLTVQRILVAWLTCIPFSLRYLVLTPY